MGFRRIKFWPIFVFAFCFLFNGCGDKESGAASKQEVPELIEPISMKQESIYVEYRNVSSMKVMETVVLPYQEELGFSRSGILENIYVYIGKKVEKGEVLAELHDEAGEEYEQLSEELTRMQEENAYNNRHFEIDIEIAKLSGQDVSRMELELTHRKELQAFEEEYLKDRIESAKKEGGNYQLLAPFSGTVTAIVGYGEGAAISADSPILALASEDGHYLQTDYVTRNEIEDCYEYYVVVDGKRYELEYIPYSDEELQMVTTKNEKKVSKYRMIDAQGAWFGRNAFVCIVGEYRENVLAVPKSVLYKERRDYYVYKIEGDLHVKTPVEVGVIGDTYAEIISGLEEGECIYVE